ncbi:MAG TPA: (Fe-S)-binding protein [Fimbriimonas sp.]
MEPTRQEFLFFQPWEKALFYLLAAVAVGYMAWQIGQKAKLWRKGRPVEWAQLREGRSYWIPTRDAFRHWARNVGTYVLGQKKVRSSRKTSGAPMHLLIFYGFLALLLATTLLGINTYSPWKFHKGAYYLAYEATFDALGLLFVAGVACAIVRRNLALRKDLGQAALPKPEGIDRKLSQDLTASMMRRMEPLKKVLAMMPGLGVQDPAVPVPDYSREESQYVKQLHQRRRFPLSHSPGDAFSLWLLLLLGLTGYWLEAARISADPKPWDSYSWVGHAIAQVQGPLSPSAYKGIWWFHVVLVLVFFAVLPKMRIRHILTAVLAAAGRPEKPMGQLRPVSMEEVEQTEQVGVKLAQDYSRWHLMSLDACMECGRCTEVCPAWNVGKVLNPKQVVQDIRIANETGISVAERVSEEALWQCTTCSACVEACPVLIRHVDLIVDARRNLVSEGALSGTAAVMLRQTASTSHAWGAPASDREKWMEGLEIPLCRDGVEFEYLFWVGCAGATDPGAVKTTKAVAALLKKAGVRFACLGREEACTGDPARRVGEEFLFQEKAMGNAAVFEQYGVKKVVTACPHCFNTFKNEYGDFGAKLEVYHHTQLLDNLVRKGELLAAKRSDVVYHDPCYLARVNDESEAPRGIVHGMEEPEHRRHKTLCCGAGGGRMWMEEPADQRPSDRRARELLETGAKTVAVACPFCRIMLDAGLRQVSPQDEIRLVDLAEMLAEANPKAAGTSLGSPSDIAG